MLFGVYVWCDCTQASLKFCELHLTICFFSFQLFRTSGPVALSSEVLKLPRDTLCAEHLICVAKLCAFNRPEAVFAFSRIVVHAFQCREVGRSEEPETFRRYPESIARSGERPDTAKAFRYCFSSMGAGLSVASVSAFFGLSTIAPAIRPAANSAG